MEGCEKLEPETVEQVTGFFTFKLQRICHNLKKKTTTKNKERKKSLLTSKGFRKMH